MILQTLKRSNTNKPSMMTIKLMTQQIEAARRSRHLGVVEDAASVVRPDDGVLPVLAEVGSSDEARLSVHLVPQRHLLVRNVPETQLPVQRAA